MTATAHLDRQRPPPIITLPAELDVATSPATAKALTAAIRPGIPIIVADMTHTIYCDSAANQILHLYPTLSRALTTPAHR